MRPGRLPLEHHEERMARRALLTPAPAVTPSLKKPVKRLDQTWTQTTGKRWDG